MRILVVGSGAREHALAWALAKHGHAVVAAPGNPGIARHAEHVPVEAKSIPALVELARAQSVELVVVGPEAPLVAGLADGLQAAGIPCFGPVSKAAKLEGSKAFAKQFCARHRIPTAEFVVCSSLAEVEAAIARLGSGGVVVKADGLAAGKGVVVCASGDEARAAARAMIEDRVFGSAGGKVVIERKLNGREASILALTDGRRLAVLPAAEDHKAVFAGDQGPNTGGMGAISPTPVVTPAVLARVRSEILEPTLAGLVADGLDYRGVIYAGLMIEDDGTPNVLEFNCRFGDPETEPLFVRWRDDPAKWLLGAASGRLPDGEPVFAENAAVCVVMAAAGYPGTPRTGDEIRGIAEAEATGDVVGAEAEAEAATVNVVVFHAGTRLRDGRLETAGGRVLAVTAAARTVVEARARAYQAVSRIHWEGAHYRRDIGARPIETHRAGTSQ
ncbi:MAG: phosphoribosylamine--glycine ligase [Pseudomonadota bacterium]